jgi:hypothetical protein
MKLSKERLNDAFFHAARETCGDEELAYWDAMESLETGTLEIEGYEQSKWVKLDPNDESTFPRYCEEVIIARWNEQHRHFNVLSALFFTDNKFYIPHSEKQIYDSPIIYWRSLPTPPVEKEVSGEAE